MTNFTGTSHQMLRFTKTYRTNFHNIFSFIKNAPRHPKLQRSNEYARRPDRDFLPSALEILETPPSPLAITMIITIATFTVLVLTWSYFGWMDIYAVSNGKVQPSGLSKIVQSSEPGRILSVKVENGTRVEKGQLLVELDPTETTADLTALVNEYSSIEAEIIRRKELLNITKAGKKFIIPQIQFPAHIDVSVSQREQDAFRIDLADLAAGLDSLRTQISEKMATINRLQSTIDARNRSIQLTRERLSMRDELAAKGSGSRALIIEIEQQLEALLTTDISDKGQVIETRSLIETLAKRMDELVMQFSADQMHKLTDADRKLQKLEQDIVKAKSRNLHTRLVAPISGHVQQLSVTTIGQIVSTGQTIMTIIPDEQKIEIATNISNKDIGFVKLGQRAIIKFQAFPFTRYGVITGRVTKISYDAIDERLANALGDPVSASSGQLDNRSATVGSQNLVYPAVVELDRNSIEIEGGSVPISSGMLASIEIRTGERRALDFVLSPIRETVMDAGHEH